MLMVSTAFQEKSDIRSVKTMTTDCDGHQKYINAVLSRLLRLSICGTRVS